ncbi:universal stress protein [Cupriavidus sp. BIS7]|uniref:universal stress protein n=1 Tax=Cupriavidus sp. BIS7 TaxID=1217718 RepID=UPI0002DF6D7B|nr:universal stress protein [Cupriavidus sp. BIS7]
MFKHMLVAVDGSSLSDRAYCNAIELARPLLASITAMQVVAHYDVMRLQTAMLQETRERYMQEAYRQAEEYLATIEKAAAAAGVTCDTACVTGDHIFQAILDEAEARQCDLIVMASHGRRGLQALLIGSETQRVLTHTRIPVLVYH